MEILSTLLTTSQNSSATPNELDPETLDAVRRQTDTFVHLAVDTNVSSCSQQQHHQSENERSTVSCTVHDRICHKVEPEQMEHMHFQYYDAASIQL